MITKHKSKDIKAELMKWMYASQMKVEGYKPEDFFGLRNHDKIINDAINEANRIHMVAMNLETKRQDLDHVGANWHANGDFDLHHALHAFLLGAGFDVGASPYAESAEPAGAGAGLRSDPGPARYVPMARF
jgi:hypothetical protein